MNGFCLTSPDESYEHLVEVFAAGNGSAFLEVREDVCFQENRWLRLGKVTVHSSVDDEQGAVESPVEDALRFGSYSWNLPTREQIFAEIASIFEQNPERQQPANERQRANQQQDKRVATHRDKTRRALDAVMHCAVKCGLVNPIFDARSVTEMPFLYPTTIVVDTTAVIQGGLDFVIRHLYPMARIKIPAIVHMEILTMADGYFKRRRSGSGATNSAATLYDHVTSQGAQRTVLRLELHTDAEIERPRLGADPLRGVVQPVSDTEDSNLKLQEVVRSFADRLILETAIQHRDRLSPDHPIMVLTADQGLARMTLGEGLRPLFFSTPPLESICGKILTGTGFRPFVTGLNDSALWHASLPSLLWELASTFGSARIALEDGSRAVTAATIGEELSWHPYHSHDDLLWCLTTTPPDPVIPQAVDTPEPDNGGPGPQPPEQTPTSDSPIGLIRAAASELAAPCDGEGSTVKPSQSEPTQNQASQESEASELAADGSLAQDAESIEPKSIDSPEVSEDRVDGRSYGELVGSYRFKIDSMFALAIAFGRKQRISDVQGSQIVQQRSMKRYQDYRNFFLSGHFAERNGDGLKKLDAMDDLIAAAKGLDFRALKSLFSRVPSFVAFLNELTVGQPRASTEVRSIGKAAWPTYVALTEISCAALDIPDEGIYLTPNSPPPKEFVEFALSTYRKLRGGERYVLTGRWLEELAKTHGIHPIVARERLNESRGIGLIERYTEGSTPETQFERHTMWILELLHGQPHTKRLNLYHGNFIIPDKASVSIRLEEKTHGTA